LHQLHAGQEQWVIARPNDEHNAEGLATDLGADASEPERTRPAGKPTWGKESRRFTFEETACTGERKHFGCERFSGRTEAATRGRFGKAQSVFGDEMPGAMDDLEARGQRSGGPTGLSAACGSEFGTDEGGGFSHAEPGW
jgi:hypothetical protein